MSLTTLAALKTDLGISGSTEDTRLTSLLRNACAIVRAYCRRYLGGVLSAASVANPAVVTSIGHGLQTGQTIIVSGSDSTPTLDGDRVVTVLTADAFTVPVNVTVAATKGNYALKLTEFYAGNGSAKLLLRQTPVQAVASVYQDDSACYGEAAGAFASDTLLTAGEDYCLIRDNGFGGEVSKSGILMRVGSTWPAASQRLSGLLTQGITEGVGNIKVTYTAGYTPVPADLVSAVHQLAAEHRRSSDSGGAMQSESFDYYSYEKMSPVDQAKAIGSVKSILANYKPWVI